MNRNISCTQGRWKAAFAEIKHFLISIAVLLVPKNVKDLAEEYFKQLNWENCRSCTPEISNWRKEVEWGSSSCFANSQEKWRTLIAKVSSQKKKEYHPACCLKRYIFLDRSNWSDWVFLFPWAVLELLIQYLVLFTEPMKLDWINRFYICYMDYKLGYWYFSNR